LRFPKDDFSRSHENETMLARKEQRARARESAIVDCHLQKTTAEGFLPNPSGVGDE
jgi:hypothetical protein